MVQDPDLGTEADEMDVDDILNFLDNMNTDLDQEQYFQVDAVADEWESQVLNGIDPNLVTTAKQAELTQLRDMQTFDLV